MIEIKKLSKSYSGKKVLNDISFDINDGEIFGLIGHNGAGKSTTIKSLVSIIDPEGGDIIVDGTDLRKDREKIKKMIGYVPDSPDIFLRMQVITYWNFIAEIYGVEPEVRDGRLEYLCKLFELDADYFEQIESYSHGMRQKVILIGALLSNPKIWVLDEPMTGLDPQSSFNLKELMKKHASEGNIVLFSTHVLEVAEKLCDKIGILSKGNLIFLGTIEELKKKNPDESLETIYLRMISEQQS